MNNRVLLILIFFISVGILLVSDHLISARGQDGLLCNGIRIGDSRLAVEYSYDLKYDESTSAYYIDNPCGENFRYLIDFKTNLLVPRVSEILIIFPRNIDPKRVQSILTTYNFNSLEIDLDSRIRLHNRSNNAILFISDRIGTTREIALLVK
jgi:hypothetical protein